MTFNSEKTDQLERATAATGALATRLGYATPPARMLEAHMAAPSSTRPTTAITFNPFWTAASEPHRARWNEADDELWQRDHDSMSQMVEADQRRQKTEAEGAKASAGFGWTTTGQPPAEGPLSP